MDLDGDLDVVPKNLDHFLSEEMWEKYHIREIPQVPPFAEVVTSAMILISETKLKVENDCMWNGHYRGGKHGNVTSKTEPAETPGDDTEPPATQVPSQQSLLKPALRMSVDPHTVVPMTPSQHYTMQTPPISDDDEDPKPITQVLETLQSAIFESGIVDDDLSDYFRGDDDGEGDWGFFDDDLDDEEEEEEQKPAIKQEPIDEQEPVAQKIDPQQLRACFAAESDHSYHKGNSVMHSVNLGIDTPSDSEEEIDVVSLGEKFNLSKSAMGAFPTNPSTQDRRQLFRTMQNRFPQGVKTIMPVKRMPGPSKKKMSEARPSTSRPRQYKNHRQNHRQYKRRYAYGHSSDSEQEPSEKRHLHNNMERQRRIDLRNLFNDLKKLVPEVNKKQRAAKVLILRGAAQYCRDLTNTNDVLERRVESLRKQQQRYRAQLSQLRRDCAAKR